MSDAVSSSVGPAPSPAVSRTRASPAPAPQLRAAHLLPPLAAVLATVSLSASVLLARAHGHIPAGVTTPPLSLAGIESPEYYFFSCGLATTSAALLAIEGLHTRALAPSLAAAATAGGPGAASAVASLRGASFYARSAFYALALIGILPLQGWGAVSTIVHLLSSTVFFFGSLTHGFTVLSALANPALAGCAVSLARAPGVWLLKAFALACALLSFGPAQLLHPGGAAIVDQEAHDLNVGGASQWVLVGGILFYYVCVTFDFLILEGDCTKEE